MPNMSDPLAAVSAEVAAIAKQAEERPELDEGWIGSRWVLLAGHPGLVEAEPLVDELEARVAKACRGVYRAVHAIQDAATEAHRRAAAFMPGNDPEGAPAPLPRRQEPDRLFADLDARLAEAVPLLAAAGE